MFKNAFFGHVFWDAHFSTARQKLGLNAVVNPVFASMGQGRGFSRGVPRLDAMRETELVATEGCDETATVRDCLEPQWLSKRWLSDEANLDCRMSYCENIQTQRSYA